MQQCTLHGTGTGTGIRTGSNGFLNYALYWTRDRDKESLFSIVPVPVPCSVWAITVSIVQVNSVAIFMFSQLSRVHIQRLTLLCVDTFVSVQGPFWWLTLTSTFVNGQCIQMSTLPSTRPMWTPGKRSQIFGKNIIKGDALNQIAGFPRGNSTFKKSGKTRRQTGTFYSSSLPASYYSQGFDLIALEPKMDSVTSGMRKLQGKLSAVLY